MVAATPPARTAITTTTIRTLVAWTLEEMAAEAAGRLGWACLGCLFPGCSTGAHSTRGRRVCCRFFKHCSVVLIICLFFSFMLLVQTRRMRDADDARKANDASRWLYARDTSTANRRYTPAHARIPVPSATPESRRPPQARIDFIFSLCIRLAHTRRRQEHTQQYLFVYIRRLLHSRMNSADFFFSFLFLGTVLTHLTNCVLRVSSVSTILT